MKFLSRERHAWLTKHAWQCLQVRLRARELSAQRGQRARVGRNQTLRPPELFCLSENYEAVATFFKEFREAALWKGARVGKRWVRNRVTVDLCDIKSLAPSAALMLAAELDRWRRLQLFRPTIVNMPKYDPAVLRLCSDLGLFELVNCTGAPAPEAAPLGNVRMIRMACGQRVDGRVAEALKDKLWQMASAGGDPQRAYESLVEAMDNAVAHAYPMPRMPDAVPWLRKIWWASGSVDIAAKRLEMFFYDQGVGIPATLPRQGLVEWYGLLLKQLDINDDAAMIAAAMEVGRSGRTLADISGRPTKPTGTGLGLHRMSQFIDTFPGSQLRIQSGRGSVTYTAGGAITQRSVDVPLGGTLLEFRIELGQGNNTRAH